MDILENLTVFQIKQKEGMLPADKYVILEYVESRGYYRVALDSSNDITRAIGIISHEQLEIANEEGRLEILGLKKIKKTKITTKKK